MTSYDLYDEEEDWTERILLWRSPRRHLYALAAASLLSIWVVELEAFNLAAREAACPWPVKEGRSMREKDHDVHLLVLADPQILWSHAYPTMNPLFRGLPPWIADHYIRKVYRALLRNWSSDGSQRVDAVLWLGDLTDEGRRAQTDAEWNRYHDHFDRLFPRPRPHRSRPESENKDGVMVLRPRPRELPFISAVGNHDISIPRQDGEGTDIESDQRAKQRFTERYGTQVFSMGNNRFKAFDPKAAKSIRAQLTKSFNVILPISATEDRGANSTITHEAILLNAMDLTGIERDSISNLPGSRPLFGGSVEAHAQKSFPETYEFVRSLGYRDNSYSSAHPPRVIFSHVPLWRAVPGSLENFDHCYIPSRSKKHGVFREHGGGGLKQDVDRYDTYQNLLSYAVSDWIKTRVGWAGGAIFSGDDHDHCEFAHELKPPLAHPVVQDFSSNELPELTVKSMSMTMGVRRPGFARISLLSNASSEEPSIAYTPCLLPDRIGLTLKIYSVLTVAGISTLLGVHTRLFSVFSRHAHRKKDSGSYELLPSAGGSTSRQSSRVSTSVHAGGIRQAVKELLLLLGFFFVAFYVFVALL